MELIMKRKLRFIAIFIIMFTTVGCDQVTKEAARIYLSPDIPLMYLKGILQFILSHNTGAFLSWGAHWPEPIRFIFFTVFVTVGVFACLFYICFSKHISNQMVIAYSLIIAGGVGNLVDRLLFSGRVTDFIHLSIGPFRTGIFNIADVAGMIGAGLFAWHHLCNPIIRFHKGPQKASHLK